MISLTLFKLFVENLKTSDVSKRLTDHSNAATHIFSINSIKTSFNPKMKKKIANSNLARRQQDFETWYSSTIIGKFLLRNDVRLKVLL